MPAITVHRSKALVPFGAFSCVGTSKMTSPPLLRGDVYLPLCLFQSQGAHSKEVNAVTSSSLECTAQTPLLLRLAHSSAEFKTGLCSAVVQGTHSPAWWVSFCCISCLQPFRTGPEISFPLALPQAPLQYDRHLPNSQLHPISVPVCSCLWLPRGEDLVPRTK